MIHPDTELRLINEEIGHGVVATRPIPRGTIIWALCEFDSVFTPQQVKALSRDYQQVLGKYAYIDNTGNYVLCWDLGRYVNHSCEPAMLGLGNTLEIVVRDLLPGDHITCDYGGLNMTTPMSCRCGAPRCRGIVRAEDALESWRATDPLVAASLQQAAHVEQPLMPFVREAPLLADWIAGRKPLPSHREYYVPQCADPVPGAGALPWALSSSVIET